MKQRIDTILVKVGKYMQDQLAHQNFSAAADASPLLSRAQQLQKQCASLEFGVSEIEEAIRGLNGKANVPKDTQPVSAPIKTDIRFQAGRASRQTLRIQIDWKANGRDHDKEEICFRNAADSMVAFLGRLVEELGSASLQKMLRVPANRGPLLSRSPSSDFVNKVTGEPYGHKRLRATDFYVLTHSSTSEKVKILNLVCRILGIVPGSVDIQAVNRPSMLDDYN